MSRINKKTNIDTLKVSGYTEAENKVDSKKYATSIFVGLTKDNIQQNSDLYDLFMKYDEDNTEVIEFYEFQKYLKENLKTTNDLEKYVQRNYISQFTSSDDKNKKIEIINQLQKNFGIDLGDIYNKESDEEIDKAFSLIIALGFSATDEYCNIDKTKIRSINNFIKNSKNINSVIDEYNNDISNQIVNNGLLSGKEFIKGIHNRLDMDNYRYSEWKKTQKETDETILKSNYKAKQTEVKDSVKLSLIVLYRAMQNNNVSEDDKALITENYNKYIKNSGIEDIIKELSANAKDLKIESVEDAITNLKQNENIYNGDNFLKDYVDSSISEKLEPVKDILDSIDSIGINLKDLSKEEAMMQLDKAILRETDSEKREQLEKLKNIYNNIDEEDVTELSNVIYKNNGNFTDEVRGEIDNLINAYLSKNSEISNEQAASDILLYLHSKYKYLEMYEITTYINEKLNNKEYDIKNLSSNSFDVMAVVADNTSAETTEYITQNSTNADIVCAHIEFGYNIEAALIGASQNRNEDVLKYVENYIKENPSKFNEKLIKTIYDNVSQTRTIIETENINNTQNNTRVDKINKDTEVQLLPSTTYTSISKDFINSVNNNFGNNDKHVEDFKLYINAEHLLDKPIEKNEYFEQIANISNHIEETLVYGTEEDKQKLEQKLASTSTPIVLNIFRNSSEMVQVYLYKKDLVGRTAIMVNLSSFERKYKLPSEVKNDLNIA